jgi:hypothetical protein
MQNWKDIGGVIISLFVLLLLGERAYDYATPAPGSYALETARIAPDQATDQPALEIEEAESDDHLGAGRFYWFVTATYQVTQKAKPLSSAFPDGYEYSYLYTHPHKLVVRSMKKPVLEDIEFVPPALEKAEGQVKLVHITATTSSER